MIIGRSPAMAGEKLKKQFSAVLCALVMVLSVPGPVLAAAKTGPGILKTAAVQENSAESDVKQLKAAQETDQIILAVGDGSGSSRIQVTYYRKTESEGWQEIFSVPGYCGNNGITADKKEGDRKTPSGDYRFSMAFGIYEDPGSVLDYHKVANTDYWVDDTSSSYYNQLVNAAVTPVSWNSAEHLINIVPQYHYGLVVDYNKDCVPGKGSAIFLHGYHSWKTWTEGCVAIPEEYVKQLLQNVDSNTRIIIAAAEADLQNYRIQD